MLTRNLDKTLKDRITSQNWLRAGAEMLVVGVLRRRSGLRRGWGVEGGGVGIVLSLNQKSAPIYMWFYLF